MAPKPTAEPLHGEALLERKYLAAAGRKQEPGTTFGSGSRWTDEERAELQKRYDEHGRGEAAAVRVDDWSGQPLPNRALTNLWSLYLNNNQRRG